MTCCETVTRDGMFDVSAEVIGDQIVFTLTSTKAYDRQLQLGFERLKAKIEAGGAPDWLLKAMEQRS